MATGNFFPGRSSDRIQYSKIVHAALVCTEGMSVCENVVLDVSVFYARLLGIFFLHLLRYGLEKSWHQKGVTVGDSSFYSSFDFPSFMCTEMLKCF